MTSGTEKGGGAPRQVGQYQLLQVLGEGTSGTVYLARRPGIERLFALKLLAANLDPEGRERVKREARIASRLDHPGICTILEAGEARGVAWVAMRLIPGETLAKRMASLAPATNAAELDMFFVVGPRALA